MESSRAIELLRSAARQMLQASAGAAALVESEEQPVRLGAAAAARLIGGRADGPDGEGSAATLAQVAAARGLGPVRFVDTYGFSRPAYYPLLVHLHLLTASAGRERLIDALTGPLAGLQPPTRPEEAPLALWWALCLDELGEHAGRPEARAAAKAVADAVVAAPGDGGSLHRRDGLDDLLDAWTFRELVGLHALAWLAIRSGDARWLARVREVAAFHEGHTQPDYTTYQPWGVSAFYLAGVQTFAEQQVHDALTQVHVQGGGAGVVPAMLLGDGVAMLEAAAAAAAGKA